MVLCDLNFRRTVSAFEDQFLGNIANGGASKSKSAKITYLTARKKHTT